MKAIVLFRFMLRRAAEKLKEEKVSAQTLEQLDRFHWLRLQYVSHNLRKRTKVQKSGYTSLNCYLAKFDSNVVMMNG